MRAGGIKSVSRFNILFAGEDEGNLDAVKAAALASQQHLATVRWGAIGAVH